MAAVGGLAAVGRLAGRRAHRRRRAPVGRRTRLESLRLPRLGVPVQALRLAGRSAGRAHRRASGARGGADAVHRRRASHPRRASSHRGGTAPAHRGRAHGGGTAPAHGRPAHRGGTARNRPHRGGAHRGGTRARGSPPHLRRPPALHRRRSARRDWPRRRATAGHRRRRASPGHHRRSSRGRSGDRRGPSHRGRDRADTHARHLRGGRREPVGSSGSRRMRLRLPLELRLELSGARRRGPRPAHRGSAGQRASGADAGRPRGRHHRSRRSARRCTAHAGKACFADAVRGARGGGSRRERGGRRRGQIARLARGGGDTRALARIGVPASRERDANEMLVPSLARSSGRGKRTRRRSSRPRAASWTMAPRLRRPCGALRDTRDDTHRSARSAAHTPRAADRMAREGAASRLLGRDATRAMASRGRVSETWPFEQSSASVTFRRPSSVSGLATRVAR